MTSSLPPFFQRAREVIQHIRLDPRRDYVAQDLLCKAMDATDPREKLRLVQASLQCYPFCTDAWNTLGYHYRNEDGNFQASIEAHQAGIEAARRIYPILNPEETEPLRWGYTEMRPYIRAIKALASAYADSGQLDLAIETSELLTRRQYTNFNGTFVVWYIQVARWKDARRLVKQSSQGVSCGIDYASVLIRYHDYVDNPDCEKSETKLYLSLANALKTNEHVPKFLTIDNIEHRAKPEYYAVGGEEEALTYAIDQFRVWESIPGALEWLLSTKTRHGAKPNEESFVQLLRRRSVLVQFLRSPAATITQNQELMWGRGCSSFHMRKECLQPHVNGSMIVAHARDKWIKFSYNDVESVPFWSVFETDDILEALSDEEEEQTQNDEKEEQKDSKNKERNRKQRNRKKRNNKNAQDDWTKFCNNDEFDPFLSAFTTDDIFEAQNDEKEEQKKIKNKERNRKRRDRRKRNKKKKAQPEQTIDTILSEENSGHIVSMIASFLSIKEKAVVRSVNKTWLKYSTLGTKVEIDPDDVGLDVNGALRFVTSSFPRLQHFSLNVNQGYFLNLNGELGDEFGYHDFGGFGSAFRDAGTTHPLKLSGESLKDIFEQESICLRSAAIKFDDCVVEHTSRILVEEEGFSTLHQQVSLHDLELSHPYFQSIHALSHMIRPLVNLQRLRLCGITLPQSEYQASDYDGQLRNRSVLMRTIGSLTNLRSLSIDNHRVTDDDVRHLSTLSELRELALLGTFGSRASQVSLTDESMKFISNTFHKLESLDVSYNRRITMKGFRQVISSCPLRELQASEAGIECKHLEELVGAKPTLHLIRYGIDYAEPPESYLKTASILSQGRCMFIGQTGLYEPKFNPKLFENHKALKKAMEEKWANESNCYVD